jgi:hypothetical protein
MFVVNLKWTRKKSVAVIIIAALVLALIVLCASHGGGKKEVSSSNIRTNEDRIAYLASLGWDCDSECVVEKNIVIPREFNEVYTQYNELQLAQGFDLTDYRGMEVTLYAYRVKNLSDNTETVYAQLIICGSEVIGGDVHSTSADGYMLPLKKTAENDI